MLWIILNNGMARDIIIGNEILELVRTMDWFWSEKLRNFYANETKWKDNLRLWEDIKERVENTREIGVW